MPTQRIAFKDWLPDQPSILDSVSEANKKYLMAFMPEQKPRTSLPFIVHQADLMAARIEFEREWLPKLS